MNAQNDIPSCLDYFKRTFAIGAHWFTLERVNGYKTVLKWSKLEC